MKSFNPYQGQAPSAFSQMGAGLAEAGANIAKSIQTGSSGFTSGIVGGINAAVNEYAKYKDVKSSVTSSEKAYETLRSFLPKEIQFAVDSQIESMGSDTGISLNDKRHFWEKTNSMLGAAVKQAMDIQKQQEADKAAMARQIASDAAARERALLGIQARAEELGGAGATVDGTAMPGAPFYDQGLQGAQPQSNPFGSLIKKRHFGGR
jgi:hypothetical protein